MLSSYVMYYAAAKNQEQQLIAASKYSARITCPGCGGQDFHLYRNNNIAPVGDDNSNSKLYEMVVECKNSQCQIVTQTFALKVKYQEDKSQDFKITGNQIIIDVFECSECGGYGEGS